MDAKEFVIEKERMLKSFGAIDGSCFEVRCSGCPFESGVMCVKDTIKAVSIVEKWSTEHPRRKRGNGR